MNNDLYLEAINQMRGSSPDSFLGKLFFNKLVYLYFYFKNLAAVFDIYFWVEKVGIVAIILFLLGFILFYKKIKKIHLLLFILLLLPVGFLNNLEQSFYYVVFIPIIIFFMYKFILEQKQSVRLLLIVLIVLNLFIQFVWSVKIIL